VIAAFSALGLAPAARAQFGPDFRLTGPPSIVSQVSPGNGWSVASDDQDNLHVVYFDARAGAADVAPFYRRYDKASAAWSAELRLPAFPNAQCRYVAVAVDPLGQVHVLWIHTVAGDQHHLYYKRRDAAGNWGPDVHLRNQPEWAYDMRDPSLAADEQGNVYAVWAEGQKNGGGQPVYNVLYMFRQSSSDTWSGASALTSYNYLIDPPPGARAPSVATHFRLVGAGVSIAHVAWADYNALAVRFRSLRSTGGAPTALGVAPTSFVGPVGPPNVAARCGEVHVVWAEPSGAQAIQYRHGLMMGGGNETTVFDPTTPTGLTGQSPNLALDGLCNLHLVMLNGGAVVHSQRSWTTGSWSPMVGVSDPAAIPADPSIASDTHGSVHVVWTDSRPGSGGAYYDRGACVATSAAAPAARAAAATASSGARPALTPQLDAARGSAAPDERLPVLIQMRDRPDLAALHRTVAGLPAAERRRRVVGTLRAEAGRSQAGVLAELIAAQGVGRAARLRPLWFINAVAARVTPAELDRLAARADIEAIAYDPPRPMLDAMEGKPRPVARALPSGGAAATAPAPTWSVNWIGAPAVWSQGYKGACVLVAVIDTGVDYTHPDLASRIWVNAGEIPGNGIDDDGNGYVDDVHGYDFYSDNGDPQDPNSHGTHVAGTVAGDGTGGTLTGVAPEARIMAVKVLGASGSGSETDVIAGIQYAVDNGAQVLNLSLGELCPDPTSRAMYRSAADAVAAAGVTMCVAAGNDRGKVRPPNMTRTPGDVPGPWIGPGQPALGATGGVTTVGATDHMSDALAYFSSPGPVDWSQPAGSGDWRLCDPGTPNVGLIKPDVSAPGMDVLSTVPGGGYALNSGTSMASPHVAGLAALMLSKNYDLTSDQVDPILETTALDLGPTGKDNDFGAGRIRAPEAIAATPAAPSPPMAALSHVNLDNVSGDNDRRLEQGETADLKVTLANNGPFLLGDVVGQLSDDSPWVTITNAVSTFGDIPVGQARDNASNLFRVVVSPGAPSFHIVHFTVGVTAYGACGSVTFPDTVYDQVVGVEPGEPTGQLPALELSGITPDPAQSSVTIGFAIRADGRVRLALYDVRGRLVSTLVDGPQPAGTHRVSWNGRDSGGAPAAPGVYLARIECAGFSTQRKFAWLGR
jgi:subtilisin family serine protease